MTKRIAIWRSNWNSKFTKLWKDEDGLGTLEIILIIAVLLIIAFLFKDWIVGLVNDLIGKADDKANEIFD